MLGLGGVLLNFAIQSLGLLRIIAWALEDGVEVGWDLSHRLGRKVFLLWQGLVLLCNWLELDLCTYPSLMDRFHIIFSGLVSGIYEKCPTFHCSEDDMAQKIFSQFLTVVVLDP